jgi:hypothetical protein
MLTFKIRRIFSATAELFFPTDHFIQLVYKDRLGLLALPAGLQVIQEGRNIQGSFPGLDTQLDKILAAYKMNHCPRPKTFHRQNTTPLALTPFSLSARNSA